MNTASQNFPRHLAELRQRMAHPTDYEKAFYYFLEEFAGDEKFMEASERDEAPHLRAIVTHVAHKALGQSAPVDDCKIYLLREYKFYHGSLTLAERAVVFFYFEEADTGVLAMIPGMRGATEMGRFRLKGGLGDPRRN